MSYVTWLVALFVDIELVHIPSTNKKEWTEYRFNISVIMPLYNTGRYLEDAFDSLIHQSIGFVNNIQLILVNDGSTDSSREICLRYQRLYPENIIYLEQNHSGVSTARNRALENVTGKYVTFFDSDDLWTLDSFQYMFTFFEQHISEVDVVSARMKMFEAWNGFPETDYKYAKTAVVDLRQHSSFIQSSPVSTFIKSSVTRHHRFSEHLQYGEDTEFVNTILLETCRLGVVREAEYCVRKRKDKSSALNNEIRSRSYLFDSPIYYHQALFDLSIARYGIVLRFIQWTIMYEIKWRLTRSVASILSPADNLRYTSLITASLQKIDNDIILGVINLPINLKLVALSKKYGRDVRFDIRHRYNALFYRDIFLLSLDQVDFLKVETVSFREEEGIAYIDCIDSCWLNEKQYGYIVKVGHGRFSPFNRSDLSVQETMFGIIPTKRRITFRIPISKKRIANVCFLFFFIDGNSTSFFSPRSIKSSHQVLVLKHADSFHATLTEKGILIRPHSATEKMNLARIIFALAGFMLALHLFYTRIVKKTYNCIYHSFYSKPHSYHLL